MTNIICDKCGSGDVREYARPKEKKAAPVYKMSEVAEGKRPGDHGGIMNAVMTYTPMILECQNCGSKLEYTKNDQLNSIVRMGVPRKDMMKAASSPLQVNPKSHNYATDVQQSSETIGRTPDYLES